MSDKVYSKIQVVGCAQESIEKAVELAVAQATAHSSGASWFEVVEIRGAIHDGKPAEWQVTVNVGGKLN
jgi:flavin-binding protein dodecin